MPPATPTRPQQTSTHLPSHTRPGEDHTGSIDATVVLGRDDRLGPPVEVCPGLKLITVQNEAALGDGSFQIGECVEAQMIRHMRHGSSPRLMALQPICVLTPRESPADPISRSPYERLRRH